MEIEITLIILAAAFLHALWNSLIKGGKDPLLDGMIISVVWLAICIIAIPFLPIPNPKSWLFAIATIPIHVAYFFLLAKSYEVGDLSRVYPIVRGVPPLIVAIVSYIAIDENLGFYGWLGVILISFGILTLEFGTKQPSSKAFILSILTAIMIAAYTIIDALGARLSGHSTSFLLWFSLFQSIIFIIIVSCIKGVKICKLHIKRHWKRGIAGGIISIISYSIILWAMTKAPIANVSALRETSVLFALIISIFFLSEKLKKSAIFSIIFILTGIIAIKLS